MKARLRASRASNALSTVEGEAGGSTIVAVEDVAASMSVEDGGKRRHIWQCQHLLTVKEVSTSASIEDISVSKCKGKQPRRRRGQRCRRGSRRQSQI